MSVLNGLFLAQFMSDSMSGLYNDKLIPVCHINGTVVRTTFNYYFINIHFFRKSLNILVGIYYSLSGAHLVGSISAQLNLDFIVWVSM